MRSALRRTSYSVRVNLVRIPSGSGLPSPSRRRYTGQEDVVARQLDPTEQWIAYGVVTDEDGDGVPDWRYGTDNMPADAAESGPPDEGGGRQRRDRARDRASADGHPFRASLGSSVDIEGLAAQSRLIPSFMPRD
jgi:hypothetical protein